MITQTGAIPVPSSGQSTLLVQLSLQNVPTKPFTVTFAWVQTVPATQVPLHTS
jgi:hypothetical protein